MSFFAEDAVALKEEPWIMGIVHVRVVFRATEVIML